MSNPRWLVAIGVLLLLLLALPTGLLGGDTWKEKAPPEWTEKDILRLLTKSPWAKSVSVWHVTGRRLEETHRDQRIYQDGPGEAPQRVIFERVESEPEVVEARYTVRWSSAATLQRAWQRLRQLKAQALVDLHVSPAALLPGYYVLTVRVAKPPASPATHLFYGLPENELVAGARLRTNRKRTTAPARALPTGSGSGHAVSFYFPGQEGGQRTVPPDTKWVEFVFKSKAGDTLKAKFKLKEMHTAGKPDY
ncbi:MAG: hypothetical protein ACE5IP_01440 [Terriglobia bacterium]